MRVASNDCVGFAFSTPDVTGWPKKGVLLELGTLCGASAIAWAEVFEANDMDWKIITVDNCKGLEPTLHGDEGQKRAQLMSMKQRGLILTGSEQEKQIRHNIKGWPNIFFRNETFEHKDSWEFNMETQLTALYYDVVHNYSTNNYVLERWKHLDYIYIDDYNEVNYPGVVKAVDEHAKKYNKNLEISGQQARLTTR